MPPPEPTQNTYAIQIPMSQIYQQQPSPPQPLQKFADKLKGLEKDTKYNIESLINEIIVHSYFITNNVLFVHSSIHTIVASNFPLIKDEVNQRLAELEWPPIDKIVTSGGVSIGYTIYLQINE